MSRDAGGSELYLGESLAAGDVRVPQGYRRRAALTVVEHVPADEARQVLEMLGVGPVPEVREVGEPIA